MSILLCDSEMNYKDPELHQNIDIGYRLQPASRKELLPQRIQTNSAVKQDIKLELAAKDGTRKFSLFWLSVIES
jgi:hypothetical protein